MKEKKKNPDIFFFTKKTADIFYYSFLKIADIFTFADIFCFIKLKRRPYVT